MDSRISTSSPVVCILDLRSGVPSWLRQSVASALGSNHPARCPAKHYVALLP